MKSTTLLLHFAWSNSILTLRNCIKNKKWRFESVHSNSANSMRRHKCRSNSSTTTNKQSNFNWLIDWSGIEHFDWWERKMETSILSWTHRYAACALFSLALNQSQHHQWRLSSTLPSLDEEPISEGMTAAPSPTVSDRPHLWIHEQSGLLLPVFRYVSISLPCNAWLQMYCVRVLRWKTLLQLLSLKIM